MNNDTRQQINDFKEATGIQLEVRDGKPYYDGNLYLIKKPIKELPQELNVNGNLELDSTQIERLPDNLTVKGFLSLGNTPIKELPDNLTVGDSLYLYKTNITQLPNDLTVKGNLDLTDTHIQKLPDNLTVEGWLNIKDTPVKELPSDLKTNSDLFLIGSQIEKLPDNLTVYGSLYADGSNIKELPDNLTVDGTLNVSQTQIEKLPIGLKIKENLDLTNTNVKELPNNLTINGNLELNFTPIKELPKGLTVERNLYLMHTPIKELPADLKVKGDIIMNNQTIKASPDILTPDGYIDLVKAGAPIVQTPSPSAINQKNEQNNMTTQSQQAEGDTIPSPSATKNPLSTEEGRNDVPTKKNQDESDTLSQEADRLRNENAVQLDQAKIENFLGAEMLPRERDAFLDEIRHNNDLMSVVEEKMNFRVQPDVFVKYAQSEQQAQELRVMTMMKMTNQNVINSWGGSILSVSDNQLVWQKYDGSRAQNVIDMPAAIARTTLQMAIDDLAPDLEEKVKDILAEQKDNIIFVSDMPIKVHTHDNNYNFYDTIVIPEKIGFYSGDEGNLYVQDTENKIHPLENLDNESKILLLNDIVRSSKDRSEEIEAYLTHQMPENQRIAFEKEMENDPELKEEVATTAFIIQGVREKGKEDDKATIERMRQGILEAEAYYNNAMGAAREHIENAFPDSFISLSDPTSHDNTLSVIIDGKDTHITPIVLANEEQIKQSFVFIDRDNDNNQEALLIARKDNDSHPEKMIVDDDGYAFYDIKEAIDFKSFVDSLQPEIQKLNELERQAALALPNQNPHWMREAGQIDGAKLFINDTDSGIHAEYMDDTPINAKPDRIGYAVGNDINAENIDSLMGIYAKQHPEQQMVNNGHDDLSVKFTDVRHALQFQNFVQQLINAEPKLSEAQSQNIEDIKGRYPDTLVLNRNGDQYEAYGKDAQKLSSLLELTTYYDKGFAVTKFDAKDIHEVLPSLIAFDQRVNVVDNKELSIRAQAKVMNEIGSQLINLMGEGHHSLVGHPPTDKLPGFLLDTKSEAGFMKITSLDLSQNKVPTVALNADEIQSSISLLLLPLDQQQNLLKYAKALDKYQSLQESIDNHLTQQTPSPSPADQKVNEQTNQTQPMTELDSLKDQTKNLVNELGLTYIPIALSEPVTVPANMDDGEEEKTFTHVMIGSKNEMFAYTDWKDAFDDNNAYATDEFNKDVQIDILNSVNKQLSDNNRQMTVFVDSLYVPDWAMNALINGDNTGLTDKEVQMVEDFFKQYPNHIFSPRDEDPSFNRYPAFGEPTDTRTVDIVRIATPEMLRQEKVDDQLAIGVNDTQKNQPTQSQDQEQKQEGVSTPSPLAEEQKSSQQVSAATEHSQTAEQQTTSPLVDNQKAEQNDRSARTQQAESEAILSPSATDNPLSAEKGQNEKSSPLEDIKNMLRESDVAIIPVIFKWDEKHFMDIEGMVRTPFLNFNDTWHSDAALVIKPVTVEYEKDNDTLLLHGENANGDNVTFKLEEPTNYNRYAYNVIKEHIEEPLQKEKEHAERMVSTANRFLEGKDEYEFFIHNVQNSNLMLPDGVRIHVGNYDKNKEQFQVEEFNDLGHLVNKDLVSPERIAQIIAQKEATAVSWGGWEWSEENKSLYYPSLEKVASKRMEEATSEENQIKEKYLHTVYERNNNDWMEKGYVSQAYSTPDGMGGKMTELWLETNMGGLTIHPDNLQSLYKQTGSKIDGLIIELEKEGFINREKASPLHLLEQISYLRNIDQNPEPDQTKTDGLMVDFGPNHFYFQHVLSGPDKDKYIGSFEIDNLNNGEVMRVNGADFEFVYNKMFNELNKYDMRENQTHSIYKAEELVRDIVMRSTFETVNLDKKIYNVPTGDIEMVDDPKSLSMDVSMVNLNRDGKLILHGNGGPAPLDSLDVMPRFEVLRRIYNDMMDQNLDIPLKIEEVRQQKYGGVIEPFEQPQRLYDNDKNLQTIGAAIMDDHNNIILFQNVGDADFFMNNMNSRKAENIFHIDLKDLEPKSQRKVLEGAMQFLHAPEAQERAFKEAEDQAERMRLKDWADAVADKHITPLFDEPQLLKNVIGEYEEVIAIAIDDRNKALLFHNMDEARDYVNGGNTQPIRFECFDDESKKIIIDTMQRTIEANNLTFSDNMSNKNSEVKIMKPDEQKPQGEQQKNDPEIKNQEKAMQREAAAAAILAAIGSGVNKLRLENDERISLSTNKGATIEVQTVSVTKNNNLSLYGEMDGTKKSISANQLTDDSLTKLASHVENVQSSRQAVATEKPVEQKAENINQQPAQNVEQKNNKTMDQEQKPAQEQKPVQETKAETKVQQPAQNAEQKPAQEQKPESPKQEQPAQDNGPKAVDKAYETAQNARMANGVEQVAVVMRGNEKNPYFLAFGDDAQKLADIIKQIDGVKDKEPKMVNTEANKDLLTLSISQKDMKVVEQAMRDMHIPLNKVDINGNKAEYVTVPEKEQKTEQKEAKPIELKPDSKVGVRVDQSPFENEKNIYHIKMYVDDERVGMRRLSLEDRKAYFEKETPQEKTAFAASLLPHYFEKELNGQKLPENIDFQIVRRQNQQTTKEQAPEQKPAQADEQKPAQAKNNKIEPIEIKPDTKMEYNVVQIPNKKNEEGKQAYSIQLFVNNEKVAGRTLSAKDQDAFFTKTANIPDLLSRYFEGQLKGQKLPEVIDRHHEQKPVEQKTAQANEQKPQQGEKGQQKIGGADAAVEVWKRNNTDDKVTFVQRVNADNSRFFQTYGKDAEKVADLIQRPARNYPEGTNKGLAYIGVNEKQAEDLVRTMMKNNVPFKAVDMDGKFARMMPEKKQDRDLTEYKMPEGKKVDNVQIFQKNDNEWYIRPKVDGNNLSSKKVTEGDIAAYTSGKATKENIVGKYYTHAEMKPKQEQEQTQTRGLSR